MCGIAGFKGVGNAAFLEEAVRRLKHRGPDDSGTSLIQDVGFAFARLAIIDLSPLGAQPMWNAEKTVGIVFNGEIYNFEELRVDLEKCGHTFQGHSDTEVLLHAYMEYGTECFKKLNGMFGLAIYDQKKDALILARDRFGKKPLYWSRMSDTIVFGSELKAILAHPKVQRELDPDALSAYLFYEYVPTPGSIFKNIHKLEPGSVLTFEKGNITINSFWEPPKTIAPLSFDEALKEFDRRLSESVQRRMVSDVPLGVFLSGGIDSSTIAYYARQHTDKPLQTFSIGFDEKSFDESSYAREVARHLGTDHHEMTVHSSDILRAVTEKLPDVLDEPLADASILPTLFLSECARKNVTVTLGGDGADELLFGYPTFTAERFASLYSTLPHPVHSIFSGMVGMMPASDSYLNLKFKGAQFLKGFNGDARYRHERWLSAFDESLIQTTLKNAPSNETLGHLLFDHIDSIRKRVSEMESWNLLSFEYAFTYLMDKVLVKVDRASMAQSLEVRAPFLDYTLAEFLFTLPSSYKYRGGTGKYILRKLMQDRLPHSATTRKKQGFAMPVSAWLRSELRPLLTELLEPTRIQKQGLFDPKMIQKMVERHVERQRDWHKELWTLLIFQLWYDRWYS